MDISIIIPCYNEGKRIRSTLLEIDRFLKNNKKINNYEIICVDDGSIDKTRKIIIKVKEKIKNILLNPKRENIGKGYSVREGILIAKYSYVLFTDADLSTPISELNKFLPYMKDYDVAIASRNLRESVVERSFWRKVFGRCFVFFINLLAGLKYRDTQCGFKLFRSDAAKDIFGLQKINGFAFDVEVLFLANKKSYKVIELPVTWIHSGESKVKVIIDSFKMMKDVIFIRINYLLNRYKNV